MMKSRLQAVIDKVDIFNEDEYGYSFNASCNSEAFNANCLGDAEFYKISEYTEDQQYLEQKLASLHKDLEFQSLEKDSLIKKMDELTKAHGEIREQMTNKLENLTLELSHNHESNVTEFPGMLQISNLLNLITNLAWNLKDCTDSKIEGHVVNRLVLQPFSFELNTHPIHDVQEKLWDILHDGEFAQLFGT